MSSSSTPSSLSSAVECHRFFAISKRVPKDVKRFCGICRQHGKLEETRGHSCEFKSCECPKCNLVRSRRLVMSQQIRLRRAQDKRFQRTTEPDEADVVPIVSSAAASNDEAKDGTRDIQQQQLLIEARNMCYFCQKCKNHGILVWKKHHKRQCPFTDCTCDFCELIETRRRLDQHIKRRKSAPQTKIEEEIDSGGDDDEREPPRKKSTASLPAQIEAMSCSDSENPNEMEGTGSQQQQVVSLVERSPMDSLTTKLCKIHQQNNESHVAGQQQQLSLISHLPSQSRTPAANAPQQSIPQLVALSHNSCCPATTCSMDSLQQPVCVPSSCPPFSAFGAPSNELLVHSAATLCLPQVLSSSDANTSLYQNGLLIDPLLAQLLLLHATNGTTATSAAPGVPMLENYAQQKALLLQFISKMIHNQQQNEQQQALLLGQLVQQQMQQIGTAAADGEAAGTARTAIVDGRGGINAIDNIMQQRRVDPSLFAAILLQHQNGINAGAIDPIDAPSALCPPAFTAVVQQHNGFKQML